MKDFSIVDDILDKEQQSSIWGGSGQVCQAKLCLKNCDQVCSKTCTQTCGTLCGSLCFNSKFAPSNIGGLTDLAL